MFSKTKGFLYLAFAAVAAAQNVSLHVPVMDDAGNPVSVGKVFINWGSFTSDNGSQIQAGQLTAPVISGAIDVTLSASGNAGYIYNVQVDAAGHASVFHWKIPAGATAPVVLSSPAAANEVNLRLPSLECNADTEGSLRRMGQSLQLCSSSAGSFGLALASELKNAANEVIRVRIFGDSMSRCAGGLCGSLGPATFSNLWVEQFRAWLNSQAPSHGTGMIPLRASITSTGVDGPPYSSSGSLGSYPLGVPSQAGASAGTAGVTLQAGASVSMSAERGDSLSIYYATYANTSTAGFHVAIDGADQGVFGTDAPGAIPLGLHVATIPAPGGLGNHTTQVTCVGACYLYAFEWTIGSSGVSVDNLSIAACRSECFAPSLGPSPGNGSTSLGTSDLAAGSNVKFFDLYVLGTNDYLQAGSVSSYQSNVQDFLWHEEALGAKSILLVSEPWTTAALQSVSQEEIFTALRLRASITAGVDYFPLPFLGPFTSPAAEAPFLEDGTHMNDAGHLAWWSSLLTYLQGGGYSWYPVTLGSPAGTQ